MPAKGIHIQPALPSYAWTAVCPSKVNCQRLMLGRFSSRRDGIASSPTFILPVRRIVLTAFSFSRPPRAATFFAMSSSAV